MSVNEQQLFEALAAKGAGTDCPSCNESDWSLSDKFAVMVLSDRETGQSLDMSRGTTAYLLICNNCGFIRYHHRKTLTGD